MTDAVKPHYHHRVVRAKTDEELETALDRFANLGWELVKVMPIADSVAQYIAVGRIDLNNDDADKE